MLLRLLLGEKTPLVLWTKAAANVPVMPELHQTAERDVYDGIALVSGRQRDRAGIRFFGFQEEYADGYCSTATTGS